MRLHWRTLFSSAYLFRLKSLNEISTQNIKLRRSYWSRAKFRFILWSNQLLMTFLIQSHCPIPIVWTKSILAAQKLIKKFEFVQNRSNLYLKRSKRQYISTFSIFYSNHLLKSDLYRNWRSNLEGSESKSPTIPFRNPNRLRLHNIHTS